MYYIYSRKLSKKEKICFYSRINSNNYLIKILKLDFLKNIRIFNSGYNLKSIGNKKIYL